MGWKKKYYWISFRLVGKIEWISDFQHCKMPPQKKSIITRNGWIEISIASNELLSFSKLNLECRNCRKHKNEFICAEEVGKIWEIWNWNLNGFFFSFHFLFFFLQIWCKWVKIFLKKFPTKCSECIWCKLKIF